MGPDQDDDIYHTIHRLAHDTSLHENGYLMYELDCGIARRKAALKEILGSLYDDLGIERWGQTNSQRLAWYIADPQAEEVN